MKNSDNKSNKENQDKTSEERKIDEQVEESFPASDTPSHVQPGSDTEDKKKNSLVFFLKLKKTPSFYGIIFHK